MEKTEKHAAVGDDGLRLKAWRRQFRNHTFRKQGRKTTYNALLPFVYIDIKCGALTSRFFCEPVKPGKASGNPTDLLLCPKPLNL